MSLELRVQHLEELVVALQKELAELKDKVSPRSEASFDLIPQAAPARAIAAPATPRASRSSAAASTTGSPPVLCQPAEAAASQPGNSLTQAERSAACREVGLFFRRALQGFIAGYLAATAFLLHPAIGLWPALLRARISIP